MSARMPFPVAPDLTYSVWSVDALRIDARNDKGNTTCICGIAFVRIRSI